ncbi:hypothetical protein [Wenjunlia tyrosinilytica]|uniref:Uncharacterized protein n=1 Tax=Wenjunlia tyrosinilytica TaxID=1544741 RepID=A0A918E0E9_9ACTN|nr:hypothetical protein [Wenjunlia tyrosinilytica]GGO94383.1 hypothetical protein GCM10012280_49080 [Wenjunlia tyrosinilytica]
MTGAFIAFVGLPGAGKSTVCEALAARMRGVALMEPEDWPPAVTDPSSAGGFTALTWFRAMRVPLYYRAVRERDQGRVAVLDTYYDKICRHLLGAEGMDWFLSPRDPYFDLYQEIAERDWELLPTADVIVSFQLSEDVWRHFLNKRSRIFDSEWGVSQAFHAQRHFVAAAETLGGAFGVPVLPFVQEISSPDAAAARLLSALRDAHVID